MLENKYYKPSIEEFRVGFECEMETTKDNWVKFKTTLNHFVYIDKWIKNKTIRVKYLDKEDIESLGFVFLNKPDPFGQLQFYKKVEIGFNCGYELTIRMSNFCGNNARFIEIEKQSYSHYENEYYKIRPIVNNISELKILLTQLGVDYE